jgi:cell division protein FtsI (penicillin-binding protein 3)
MAGKTGTARTEYWLAGWEKDRKYISSFAGYFPAENPKYSCIVVIHKPSTKKGYYGADVTGPVFKRIAQKIFTDSPRIAEIEEVDRVDEAFASDFENYYNEVQKTGTAVPDVSGMAGMDAVSLLENMGMRVEIKGNGTVASQSIEPGAAFRKRQIIQLMLK